MLPRKTGTLTPDDDADDISLYEFADDATLHEDRPIEGTKRRPYVPFAKFKLNEDEFKGRLETVIKILDKAGPRGQASRAGIFLRGVLLPTLVGHVIGDRTRDKLKPPLGIREVEALAYPAATKVAAALFKNPEVYISGSKSVESLIDDILSPKLERYLEPQKDEATALVKRLAELIDERPELAFELSKQPGFRKIFQSASKGAHSKSKRPIPTEVPELYEGRGKGSGENAVGFLRRVYSDWLPTPLSISDIGDLDPKLYGTLKSWVRDRKPPADLTEFFKSKKRRTPEEIDAELKKHRIDKPEDAFARFPNDKKTAARLYNAALRRQ